MLHRRHLLAALFLSTSMATTAVAQTPAVIATDLDGDAPVDAPVEVRFRRSTNIDVDAAPIEGTRQGPRITRLNGKKKTVFSPMIPLRTNFRDALSSSSAAL